jgi:hypothetical protein
VPRIVALLPLVVGVIVVIQNRRFDDASERSARQTFVREPGWHAHLAGRVIAVSVGVIMVVAGATRLLGVW